MAPPKPKPRKQLAQAHAAALKWVEKANEKPDSEQWTKAWKNLKYVENRLLETGGHETTLEKAIARRHMADRSPVPAPSPTIPRPGSFLSPDAGDRAGDARARNAARGARPIGGPGKAERDRATKAFTGAKRYRPAAILNELETAGYDVPRGKPRTKAQAAAMNKDVGGDLKSYLSILKASEKAAFLAAAEDPFNIKRNTKIVGKEGATILYGHAREKASQLDPMRPELGPKQTWASKIVEAGAAGIGADPAFAGLGDAVPWFRDVVAEDVKNLAVESLLGIPAIAETAYNDFTGRTRWGLAKLAKEGGTEFARLVEGGLPPGMEMYTLGRAAIEVVKTGDVKSGLKIIKDDIDQFATQWSQKPVTTAVNVIPGVNMAARGVGFATLAARMARLNPHLSKVQIANAARKESYVPGSAARRGIKGGIPIKVLTGKIFDVDGESIGEFQAPARSWSRTPVGRAGQRLGHAMGKEVTLPSGKVVRLGPLSETARAASSLKKRRGMQWERARVEMLQQMKPITEYVKTASIPKVMKDRYLNMLAEHRTRLAETFYGPQGPDRATPEATLQAVLNDMRTMQEEGGLDIPTKRKERIDAELDSLDRQLRNLGMGIDESAGLWGQAQDVMRQAGRPEPEIRTYLELAKARARTWAQEAPDRDPQDWLESPDGRNLAGFAYGAPTGDLPTLAQAVSRSGPHIPNVRLPEQRLQENVTAKTSGRSKATGIPETPVLRTTLNGQEFQIAGEVTPEAWLERVEAVVPDAVARDNLARWYEHYVPMFRRAFGKDANAIMRGFAVSQANASPASGLGAVLRVMDGIREGKEITKKGYGSVVAENIGKAVRDGEIDSFIAAKLFDFINSLEGSTTRGWMKNHPDLGMPAAVDVHAIRDRGFIDEKLVARMESVHGYQAGRDYIIEGDGTASGGKYERIAEWYQDVANHLNAKGFDGRKDWTPAQAQALGWSTIQLAHKTVPEGFAEAFAYNTRAITFEVTKGPGGLGAELTLKQSRAAARAMLKDARRLVKETPGIYLVDAKIGTGNWNQGANANITVRVMGSKDSVQKALTTFAQAFDQEWVQGTREVSGANSRATLILDSPKFRNPETAARFFAALNRIDPSYEGSMDYDVKGVPGMAIRTSSPSVTPKTQMAFLRRQLAAVNQAERELGIEVGLGVRNIEMITGGQHGEVAPVSTLPGSGRGIERGALDDPSAARIRERLEGVVAEVGAGGAARTAGAAGRRRGGDPRAVRTLYQADPPYPGEMKGWETRIPVLIDRRDMSQVIIGRPGDTHADIDPSAGTAVRRGTDEIVSGHGSDEFFQTEITIDPTDGKVLYAPREVGLVEAQARVDAYLAEHYPNGVGGKGPRVPESTKIERHNVEVSVEWEGFHRVPWIYDPDSGILHVGTPGSDHTGLSRAVYKKYGYNESLNREWTGVWASKEGRVVLHGNETGDMPSDDFPLDPRLGPVIKEAFGKKLKHLDHETGEILDMPEDSGAIGYGRPEHFSQTDPVDAGIRGAVQFLDSEGGRQLLYLSEKANASTLGHELFGHAAYEMKRNQPAEFAAVEKRYGKKLEDWGEKEHERLARETERYLMSGKAPTPELEPIFAQMRKWMYEVYETIKALGRPMPAETRALLDRYFGKQPLEFDAPQNVYRRTSLPDNGDPVGVSRLVDDSLQILARPGLENDPARRKEVAGNMLWLEQQVLPYMDNFEGPVQEKIHDAFEAFEEAKAGKSIFTPEQAAAIKQYGILLGQRGRELEKSEQRLAAQPDFVKISMARDVKEALDDPDIDLEGLLDASSDLQDLMYEWDQKTKFGDQRSKRRGREIADLERALDPNRRDVTKAERDEAIIAMREISEQNEQIFIDVFGEGLSPPELEKLKAALERRRNILARRLKDLGELPEDSGTGAFVPHYSYLDVVQSKLRGAVRLPAAGGNRKVLSLKPRQDRATFSKGGNRLIRYKTAELAVTPQALLSQYMRRMRFVETASLRKELFDIGVEIPRDRDGKSTGRVPRGWYVINGTGAAVPERIRAMMNMTDEQIDHMLGAGEDVDAKISTDEGMTSMLEEYRNAFLKKTYTGRIPDDWDGERLRMVPPEIVEHMVGKVFESAPGGYFAATLGLASIMARFSTIYAHAPGYIGANVVANTVMLGATKPGSLYRGLREFAKYPGTLRSKDPEFYEWVATEGGDVLADAGLPDFYVRDQNRVEALERAATAFSSRWAGALGDLADRPFRVAAWIGEAKREGFTTIEQWKELRAAQPGTELARVRDTIAQRTRENMIDFNKLSDVEKRAARWVFIWPFIRGAAKWPFWFMSEYPGRAAFMANAARAQNAAYGEEDPESVLERYNRKAPVGERSMFDLFDVPLPPGLGGGTVNLSPVHPLGVLTEKVDEVAKLAGGDLSVLGDVLNPAFRTGGSQIFGDRGFDPKAIAEVTIPYYSYYRAKTEPRKRGAQKYTDRDSFWDYIRRREGRFWPETVDYEKVKEAKKKEDADADKRPSWEKTTEEELGTVEKIFAEAKKRNIPVSPEEAAAVKKSVTAYNALDRAESDYADELGIDQDSMSELQKIEATERVFKEYYPVDSQRYLEDRDLIESLPEKKIRGGGDSQALYRSNLRKAIQYWRSEYWSSGRDWKIVED